VMRGFRNKGTTELKVLAMVGGDTGGGSVTWHEDVLSRAASQTGLAIDPAGNLIKLENFKQPAGLEGSTV